MNCIYKWILTKNNTCISVINVILYDERERKRDKERLVCITECMFCLHCNCEILYIIHTYTRAHIYTHAYIYEKTFRSRKKIYITISELKCNMLFLLSLRERKFLISCYYLIYVCDQTRSSYIMIIRVTSYNLMRSQSLIEI